MQWVFWVSLLFLIYVYIGYPLVLALLVRPFRRTVYKRYIEPNVTVVVVARDEAGRMERRLQNLSELDYPKDKLQIIVSLDGPKDGTEAIVQGHKGVRLVYSPWRRGKAAAINAAMVHATGEIVVFADARQVFSPNTVRELAANFADYRVGAATGELVLTGSGEGGVSKPIGLYWRYEKKIRALESQLHSVVGVTGAIYAMRRTLFEPLPVEAILDDVMSPMRIVLAGKRVIFDPEAKAYDEVACCPDAEYRRKVRTLTGNYQLLSMMPQLLNPFRNPVFLQFVSHKAARLFAPYAMILLFASNALLVGDIAYAIAFAAQGAWYASALVGYAEMLRAGGQPLAALEERRKAA